MKTTVDRIIFADITYIQPQQDETELTLHVVNAVTVTHIQYSELKRTTYINVKHQSAFARSFSAPV